MNFSRMYSDSRIESPCNSPHQNPSGARFATRHSMARSSVTSTLKGGSNVPEPAFTSSVTIAGVARNGSLAAELANVVTRFDSFLPASGGRRHVTAEPSSVAERLSDWEPPGKVRPSPARFRKPSEKPEMDTRRNDKKPCKQK